jgi:hypothetical protein
VELSSYSIPLTRCKKFFGQRDRQLIVKQIFNGLVGDAVFLFEFSAGVAHCILDSVRVDRVLDGSADR